MASPGWSPNTRHEVDADAVGELRDDVREAVLARVRAPSPRRVARASAARFGFGSAITTIDAPTAFAYRAERMPIGPAPVTRTTSPPCTPARSMP